MMHSMKRFGSVICMRGRLIDVAVEAEDAAERAERIALVGTGERLRQRRRGRRPARIVVLDDDRGRRVRTRGPGSRALSRSRMLLYDSSLPCSTSARATVSGLCARLGVKGRALMRVLAVAQRLLASNANVNRGGGRDVPGPRCARRSRPRWRHHRRRSARTPRRRAVRVSPGSGRPGSRSSSSTRGVLGRIGDDGDIVIVLRRRPHHRRPADVDVLDDLLVRAAGFGDGRLERIEVAHDQVDRRDLLLLERRLCCGLSRTARMPPCTRGCSVLTRPSSISGKPVTSAMSMTARPASASALRVPPVEINSTPSAARACANSTRPVLSLTLSKARRIRRTVMSGTSGGGFLAMICKAATRCRYGDAFHRFMHFTGMPVFETNMAVFAISERMPMPCVIVSRSDFPSGPKCVPPHRGSTRRKAPGLAKAGGFRPLTV